MKKTILTVVAFLVLFGFAVSGAMAQATWTWDNPYPISLPTGGKYVELSADPANNALYGIDESGAASSVITTTASVTPPQVAPNIQLSSAADLVVGFGGVVYVIDIDTVGTWSASGFQTFANTEQPKIPSDKTGTFKHIASGNNGKLYVLFETMDESEQYLLVGNPPVQGALVVKLNPQSLNLRSKGNWVTCLIQIPGYPIEGIDPSSIVITQFEINGTPYPVNVPVDDNAPMDLGTDKLMVKFVRYDKGNPTDPESFVGALSPLLPPGSSSGKVDVTATVQATHDAGTFSGEATFQVIVPKEKKGKP
jgi:hypothetical protein